RDLFYSRGVPFALSGGEQRAVDSLRGDTGTVLATSYLAGALPALAGLLDGQVHAGPDHLLDGQPPPAVLRRVVRAERITRVIIDCLPGRADLSRALDPLGFVATRYGCARVYRRGPPVLSLRRLGAGSSR
ncbi:MAG TPA: hypothetical protein VGH93_13915, partial [Solirubrobacteraceae bacterium]